MLDTVASAKQTGFVETLFGRRRFIPEIYSSSAIVRNSAERAAINMPVQGSAADIMKIAMIAIDNLLKSYSDINMLLQVHDELILEAPEAKVQAISKEVKDIMDSCFKLSVPLIVEIETGPNWADLKPLQF